MKSMGDSSARSIQQATSLDEVDNINAFFNSTEIKNDLHWFTYRDTLVRAFERDDRELYYVEDDSDGIVAALMVWCESRVLEDGEAQIRLVAVSPDSRGQGLGESLCSRAEEFARNQRKESMIADVVTGSPAVKFWKSIGYNNQSEWETKKGTSMLTVEKSL